MDIVKYLLEMGMDQEMKNTDGKTALVKAHFVVWGRYIRQGKKKVVNTMENWPLKKYKSEENNSKRKWQ